MTQTQTVVFDRFLAEVAPLLTGTAVVLTAEQVALAIAGLDLAAGIKAELEHITLDAARAEVFAPLNHCIDAATFEEVRAALELVRMAPVATSNTLTQGLEAIGVIITSSGHRSGRSWFTDAPSMSALRIASRT